MCGFMMCCCGFGRAVVVCGFCDLFSTGFVAFCYFGVGCVLLLFVVMLALLLCCLLGFVDVCVL